MDDFQEKFMLHVYVLIFTLFLINPHTAYSEINIHNKYSDSMKEHIINLKDHLKSEDFNNKIKNNVDLLDSKSLPEMNQYLSSESIRSDTSNISGNYVLFISSSIPLNTLRAYAHDISENNLPVTMILKGFVGGMTKMKPTVQFIKSIIQVDDDCQVDCDTYNVDINIDPELFNGFNIKSVPAFTDLSGSTRLYGDADVAYLIERMK